MLTNRGSISCECRGPQKAGFAEPIGYSDVRKRSQQAHPNLTLTEMDNVLVKLHAGQPLDAQSRVIHDQGLVSVLRDLHDDLDRAVSEA